MRLLEKIPFDASKSISLSFQVFRKLNQRIEKINQCIETLNRSSDIAHQSACLYDLWEQYQRIEIGIPSSELINFKSFHQTVHHNFFIDLKDAFAEHDLDFKDCFAIPQSELDEKDSKLFEGNVGSSGLHHHTSIALEEILALMSPEKLDKFANMFSFPRLESGARRIKLLYDEHKQRHHQWLSSIQVRLRDLYQPGEEGYDTFRAFLDGHLIEHIGGGNSINIVVRPVDEKGEAKVLRICNSMAESTHDINALRSSSFSKHLVPESAARFTNYRCVSFGFERDNETCVRRLVVTPLLKGAFVPEVVAPVQDRIFNSTAEGEERFLNMYKLLLIGQMLEQLVELVKDLEAQGYCMTDIKPENFLTMLESRLPCISDLKSIQKTKHSLLLLSNPQKKTIKRGNQIYTEGYSPVEARQKNHLIVEKMHAFALGKALEKYLEKLKIDISETHFSNLLEVSTKDLVQHRADLNWFSKLLEVANSNSLNTVKESAFSERELSNGGEQSEDIKYFSALNLVLNKKENPDLCLALDKLNQLLQETNAISEAKEIMEMAIYLHMAPKKLSLPEGVAEPFIQKMLDAINDEDFNHKKCQVMLQSAEIFYDAMTYEALYQPRGYEFQFDKKERLEDFDEQTNREVLERVESLKSKVKLAMTTIKQTDIILNRIRKTIPGINLENIKKSLGDLDAALKFYVENPDFLYPLRERVLTILEALNQMEQAFAQFDINEADQEKIKGFYEEKILINPETLPENYHAFRLLLEIKKYAKQSNLSEDQKEASLNLFETFLSGSSDYKRTREYFESMQLDSITLQARERFQSKLSDLKVSLAFMLNEKRFSRKYQAYLTDPSMEVSEEVCTEIDLLTELAAAFQLAFNLNLRQTRDDLCDIVKNILIAEASCPPYSKIREQIASSIDTLHLMDKIRLIDSNEKSSVLSERFENEVMALADPKAIFSAPINRFDVSSQVDRISQIIKQYKDNLWHIPPDETTREALLRNIEARFDSKQKQFEKIFILEDCETFLTAEITGVDGREMRLEQKYEVLDLLEGLMLKASYLVDYLESDPVHEILDEVVALAEQILKMSNQFQELMQQALFLKAKFKVIRKLERILLDINNTDPVEKYLHVLVHCPLNTELKKISKGFDLYEHQARGYKLNQAEKPRKLQGYMSLLGTVGEKAPLNKLHHMAKTVQFSLSFSPKEPLWMPLFFNRYRYFLENKKCGEDEDVLYELEIISNLVAFQYQAEPFGSQLQKDIDKIFDVIFERSLCVEFHEASKSAINEQLELIDKKINLLNKLITLDDTFHMNALQERFTDEILSLVLPTGESEYDFVLVAGVNPFEALDEIERIVDIYGAKAQSEGVGGIETLRSVEKDPSNHYESLLRQKNRFFEAHNLVNKAVNLDASKPSSDKKDAAP